MAIHALVQRGVYVGDIARQLGVHPKTVNRALLAKLDGVWDRFSGKGVEATTLVCTHPLPRGPGEAGLPQHRLL